MLLILSIILSVTPIEFMVPGLTCPTCVAPVKKALALTDGVKKVEIDWRTRMVKVTVDKPDETTRKRLSKVLSDAGYGPEPENILIEKAGVFGDYLMVETAPQRIEQLAVWGKVTLVAVCTPDCAPCDQFKRDVHLFSQRVKRLAVRILVVEDEDHPAAKFLPQTAAVPYIHIFDQTGRRAYLGKNDGNLVYKKVETLLRVVK